MGDAAAVTDDIKTGVAGFQTLVDLDLHIVELNFYTIKEGIVIGGTGGDFVQRIDHFDDAVEDSLGQYQTQITGGRLQGGRDKGFLDPLGGGALTADQVTEALYDDTAAQHIAESCNGLTISVRVLEGLGEMLGN